MLVRTTGIHSLDAFFCQKCLTVEGDCFRRNGACVRFGSCARSFYNLSLCRVSLYDCQSIGYSVRQASAFSIRTPIYKVHTVTFENPSCSTSSDKETIILYCARLITKLHGQRSLSSNLIDHLMKLNHS